MIKCGVVGLKRLSLHDLFPVPITFSTFGHTRDTCARMHPARPSATCPRVARHAAPGQCAHTTCHLRGNTYPPYWWASVSRT
eukprot:5271397-Pyramimonas_sp.AAC.1